MLDYLEAYKELEEAVLEIEKLSGYSLESLREKFAAGWTLVPSKNSITLSELIAKYGHNDPYE